MRLGVNYGYCGSHWDVSGKHNGQCCAMNLLSTQVALDCHVIAGDDFTTHQYMNTIVTLTWIYKAALENIIQWTSVGWIILLSGYALNVVGTCTVLVLCN